MPKRLEGNGRPKDLALDIDGKDKLEMLGVAPGSFMMGFDEWQDFKGFDNCELDKPRRVIITRPYWMGKFPLTYANVRALFPDHQELRNVPDDRGCFVETKKISHEEILEKLNSKFPDRPKGYVFRLPTAAEWEYAVKADEGENTTFDDFNFGSKHYWATPEMEAYCEKAGIRIVDNLNNKGQKVDVTRTGGYWKVYLPVDLTKANAWGFRALGGFFGESLLDTADPKSFISNGFWVYAIKRTTLPEKDPFYWHEGGVVLVRAARTNLQGYTARTRRNEHIGIRVVLGPDLVAEKRGGAVSAVQSSNRPATPVEAAGSSKANRLGKNVHADRPKDMSFKLNAKESLEMVGIPSGKFMMGQVGAHLLAIYKVREVEISRPFWFSRYPLTFGGAKALKGMSNERFLDLAKRRGVTEDCCALLKCDEAEVILNKLNGRFVNRPNGYVFRFPTAAELEYAYKADKCDEVDLVRLDLLSVWRTKEVSDYGRSKSFPDDLLGTSGDFTHYVPVRMSRLNAWGIGAVGEVHGSFVLDTYDRDTLVGPTWYLIDRFAGIDAVGAKDPVFLCQGGDMWRIVVGGKKGMEYQSNVSIAGLRIVLGPDLLAEKKSGK